MSKQPPRVEPDEGASDGPDGALALSEPSIGSTVRRAGTATPPSSGATSQKDEVPDAQPTEEPAEDEPPLDAAEPEPVEGDEATPSAQASEASGDDPPTLPRMVVSMIAEELGEEPDTDPRAPLPEAGDPDASQPLALEPAVDAAVSKKPQVWPNLSEEIAELHLLILRGLQQEAAAGWQSLAEAHPGHPDLIPVGEELGLQMPRPRRATLPPGLRILAPDTTEEPVDITQITPRYEELDEGDPPAPIETPTSPTLVEGTSPPPGGFAPVSADPEGTPPMGLEARGRLHAPSTESLPTNPRLPGPAVTRTPEPATNGLRLVMLGPRGETAWEQTVPQGDVLEVGRDAAKPWSDDSHIEAAHAKLHATAQGVRVEPLGDAGVYRKVDERLAVRDGDEFRVGESLLRYTAADEGWGTLTCFPLSGSESTSVEVRGRGVMVGREDVEIDIPQDTFVSGAHCRFSCGDDGLYVEDLGSANGTYVRLRGGESVAFGGLVLIGQTQFRIRRNA